LSGFYVVFCNGEILITEVSLFPHGYKNQYPLVEEPLMYITVEVGPTIEQ